MANLMKKPAFLSALVLFMVAGAGLVLFGLNGHAEDGDGDTAQVSAARPRRRSTPPATDNPVNGERAYGYLQQICDIGRRVSGTAGMTAQQKLLAAHFTELGAKVALQRFRYRHPQTGAAVNMANLIIEWHPEAQERVLLCAHYDTRPFPDRDPVNPQGEFIGANDGGSGVALLMELGHLMGALDPKHGDRDVGVDFVLFDAEEFVFGRNDRYFLGSEYFSRDYATQPPAHKYRWAVLLDMVGDADLQIYQERNSLSWRETRPLIRQIWDTAARLGIDEFVARPKHEIQDDHLKLYYTAKIPSCDIIDFDYPAWHTEADRPEACSAESLAKVGWVMHEWLRTMP
jgi:glutaminyl-peptide cyclotransferase